MSDGAGAVVVAAALGLLLGLAFYGGLWWTVRRALRSRRAALWFVGSLALRTVAAVAGIWAVGGAQWQRLAACAVGFLAARLLVERLSRPALSAALPDRVRA